MLKGPIDIFSALVKMFYAIAGLRIFNRFIVSYSLNAANNANLG